MRGKETGNVGLLEGCILPRILVAFAICHGLDMAIVSNLLVRSFCSCASFPVGAWYDEAPNIFWLGEYRQIPSWRQVRIGKLLD